MTNIHPTALVDPSAVIADSVEIGPYSVVGPEVVIGAGTILHHHVVVQSLTMIGEGNVFYPFSVIGADPQDRKFKGERSTCEIGHRNKIREHVTIHRGTANGGGVTRVGNDNLIMVAVHIAHDCMVGDEIVLANQAMVAGHVVVESGANVGGGAGLHHYTTIGSCAFVSALARVGKDVPPFMIVEGNPADVRGINIIAMTRRGYSQEHIDAVKDAYKRLYRHNAAPMTEKLEELRRDHADVPAVIHLCDAIAASASGTHGRALENLRHDDKRAVDAPCVEVVARTDMAEATKGIGN